MSGFAGERGTVLHHGESVNVSAFSVGGAIEGHIADSILFRLIGVVEFERFGEIIGVGHKVTGHVHQIAVAHQLALGAFGEAVDPDDIVSKRFVEIVKDIQEKFC